MIVKEFKNGNINIKLEPDEIERIEENPRYTVEILNDGLFWNDTYYLTCGAFNTDGYYIFYNCRLDKLYTIFDNYDIHKKLLKNKTVKLIARTPDENDRQLINEYFN